MSYALCLDLMGTLVRDPYREAVRAATGLELDAVHAVKDPNAWPAFEVGEIDEAEFARRFFADPVSQHTFDLGAFHRVRRDGYAFLPGMEQLLDDAAGVAECYVASNYPVWVEELAERFRLRERTQGVWSSHHLGVRKPARGFYEQLLERIGRAAEECLFVDDREDNCRGAEAVGMRAHRFVGADDLRARLRAEGLPL
jgi:FMN hydrolase / 5-amino-6-(5-phospho-D-ribitylamino)uracil phosphatase